MLAKLNIWGSPIGAMIIIMNDEPIAIGYPDSLILAKLYVWGSPIGA